MDSGDLELECGYLLTLRYNPYINKKRYSLISSVPGPTGPYYTSSPDICTKLELQEVDLKMLDTIYEWTYIVRCRPVC